MIKLPLPAAVCLALAAWAGLCGAGELSPAPESLLAFTEGTTAGFAVYGQAGSRDFVVGGSQRLNVDMMRFSGRLTADLLPSMALYGGAGWARAEIDRVEGEGGIAAEVGLLLNVIQYEAGRDAFSLQSQNLALLVDINGTWWESNFGATELSWLELTLTPQIAYTITRLGDVSVHNYDPPKSAVRGGFTFAYVDGTYGTQSLDSNRNFGGFVAGDVMLRSNWVITLDAVIYGGNDRLGRLLLGRYF